MTALERIEAAGYAVRLKSNGKLGVSFEGGMPPPNAAELLEALRRERDETIKALQMRAQGWGFPRPDQLAADYATVVVHLPASSVDYDILRLYDNAEKGGAIVIDRVRVFQPSGDVDIHYRPTGPPEWIDWEKYLPEPNEQKGS